MDAVPSFWRNCTDVLASLKPETRSALIENRPRLMLSIANREIYILKEHRQPVPLGTPGELYIGGAGVGRGYLNRPDISAQKFIAH